VSSRHRHRFEPSAFAVTGTDVNGSAAARTLLVCPTITLSGLTGGGVGAAYNQTVVASGGVAAYTYAVTSGTLPTGLTLSAGGVLSGTPTAAGFFTFTITATDANLCTGTQSYTIGMSCPTITVNPVSLPGGGVTLAYSQTITATGGNPAYTFTISSGALPAGLTLAAGGLLSGAPTEIGIFNFTVTATDNFGCTGNRAYTIVITCVTITLNPASLPNGTVGTAYSQTVVATPIVAPVSYGVIAGALPTGLSLNTSSGLISGTPSGPGFFNYRKLATDDNGSTDFRDY
jgi:hypothetical protein